MPTHKLSLNNQTPTRILIIEDEPLLALDLEDTLVNAGFAVVGTASTLEMALKLIETVACDAAILDANLAGLSASPAALAMGARGLPFIVLSGYSREQQQETFTDALYIQKPCRPTQLIHALNTIINRGS
jgi:DNA-binding response OmpR family regulator